MMLDRNGDDVNTYIWDRADRLLSMGEVSYRYNGMGQRVEQTVGANTTQYTLDVALPLWEVLAATTGANTSFYLHDSLGLMEQQDAGGVDWMLADGSGSLRGVVNSTLTPLVSRRYPKDRFIPDQQQSVCRLGRRLR